MSTRWTFQCRSSREGKSARKWPPRLSSRRSAARTIRRATVRRLKRRHSPALGCADRSSVARWLAQASSSCAAVACSSSRVRSRPAVRHIRSRTAVMLKTPSSEEGPAAASSRLERPDSMRSAFNTADLWRLLHRLRGASPEYQPFEQRVARQAVGAVDPGAGGFTCGEESGNGGAAPLVGVDAPHQIVGGGADRDRIGRQIESHVATHRGDSREPLVNARAIQMRERQEHGTACLLGLPHDAARDDIARRQIAIRVIPRHERLAARVDEPRPFAAKRLGEEKSRRAWAIERGRVELHELEIRHARSRMIGERDAVTGRDRGVRGFPEDLPGPAGREQRRARAHLMPARLAVKKSDAANDPLSRRRAR